MKTIKAIIEKSEDGGYGIYAPSIKGAYGYGLTEEEAKEDFLDILNEQAEYYKEKKGTYPEWYSDALTFEFKYDFSAFFQAFPFFNVSQFANAIGINPSLMRKYKEGLAFASEKQKSIIQDKFKELVSKMALVEF